MVGNHHFFEKNGGGRFYLYLKKLFCNFALNFEKTRTMTVSICICSILSSFTFAGCMNGAHIPMGGVISDYNKGMTYGLMP